MAALKQRVKYLKESDYFLHPLYIEHELHSSVLLCTLPPFLSSNCGRCKDGHPFAVHCVCYLQLMCNGQWRPVLLAYSFPIQPIILSVTLIFSVPLRLVFFSEEIRGCILMRTPQSICLSYMPTPLSHMGSYYWRSQLNNVTKWGGASFLSSIPTTHRGSSTQVILILTWLPCIYISLLRFWPLWLAYNVPPSSSSMSSYPFSPFFLFLIILQFVLGHSLLLALTCASPFLFEDMINFLLSLFSLIISFPNASTHSLACLRRGPGFENCKTSWWWPWRAPGYSVSGLIIDLFFKSFHVRLSPFDCSVITAWVKWSHRAHYW